MPIRINLLAEAQAAEELRRKDPVKRATMAAGFLIFLIVLRAGSLELKIMSSKKDFSTLETKWKSIEKNYQEAVDSQRQAIEAEQKLVALQQLTTNRFLWGNVLNALQQSLNGVDDLQVVRFKADQVYLQNEGTPARTNDSKIVPGKPATATEKITLTIDATDSSPQPGTQVTKFKENISSVPYFQNSLQRTNGVLLTSLSAPQMGVNRGTFVMFTLQCYFPEKVR